MRIRTVKPEFFTHAGLFDAEQETKLPLRVGFVGLWCACDREGRFKWEPCRLGVMILPYDGLEFSRVLDALVTRGFVVKYRVEGSWFGTVISFKAHQVINNRESASVLPDVSEAEEVIQSDNTRAPRVNDACSTPLMHAPAEGKGIWKGIIPLGPPQGAVRGRKTEEHPNHSRGSQNYNFRGEVDRARQALNQKESAAIRSWPEGDKIKRLPPGC